MGFRAIRTMGLDFIDLRDRKVSLRFVRSDERKRRKLREPSECSSPWGGVVHRGDNVNPNGHRRIKFL